MRIITIFLFSAILVACGENPDRGIARKNVSQNSVGSSTHVTYSASATSTGFSSCFYMTKYAGTDSAYASSTFGAVNICPGLSKDVVKLKTSANFPTTTRFCLIPVNQENIFPETCFTINGTLDVVLSNPNAIAVALVRETDLNAMLSYFRGQSSTFPPMAYASIR